MSSFAQAPGRDTAIRTLPLEERRGIYAMWCVIATECSLFACLFAAYFYLGNTSKERWQLDSPPKMMLAFIMLLLLLSSSAVLEWGERQIKQNRYSSARLALAITILIGIVFWAFRRKSM